ncbi:MAG: hypothetical protein ACHQCH_07850 [Solirubrobacterales bacterium]
MRHLNFKRRLAGEAGFVLPSAIIVLFILTLLTGAAIAVAVQTSTSTTRDNNVKAELAAAEAGLQVASYRLSQLNPGETQCINGSEAVTASCNNSPESLGNSATFQYWTTLPLKAGEKCAGRTIATESGVTQRCVTSEGLVNSVKPGVRLQASIKSTISGEPLFPVHGLLGLEEIHVSGSVKVPGLSASNGTILEEGGAALEGGYELGPSPPSKFKKEGGATVKPPEKTRSAAEGKFAATLPATHATKEANEDSRITECVAKGCAAAGKDEFYTAGKAVNKFTGSPNYELKLGSLGELTLSGSKYFLCNFHAEHAGKLIIAAGSKVEIFIGSPEGTSKCPAGTGKFETEEFKLENHAGPGGLVVIMEGKGPFLVSRGALFEGGIYAPEAEVTFEGGAEFTGGIVGKKVRIANGVYFKWGEELGGWINGAGVGSYTRKAWEQCTPGSGASEGC